jgi:hypothetical protein
MKPYKLKHVQGLMEGDPLKRWIRYFKLKISVESTVLRHSFSPVSYDVWRYFVRIISIDTKAIFVV